MLKSYDDSVARHLKATAFVSSVSGCYQLSLFGQQELRRLVLEMSHLSPSGKVD